MNNNSLPLVTVIIPVRNEAKSIQQVLMSVFNQEYPLGKMEILVVDGMSSDGTRSQMKDFMDENPQVKLTILDNSQQIVPPALNIGIQQATGEFILRVDGHCELPTNYIKTCVENLKTEGVENVGGQQYPVGRTYLEKAIALAISSPVFIGNSYFRYGDQKRFVDTVFLGAYPRHVFEEVGLFDEGLVRHQDYDFNLRLRNQGGKILYIPELKVKYHPRSSISSFFKQYFQYGLWKVRVMQKSKHAFRLRHYAPTALVFAVMVGAILSVAIPGFTAFYLLGALFYLLGAAAASLFVSCKHQNWKYLPVLPVIFMSIHFGWGLGFWWGIIRWYLLPKSSGSTRNAS